MPAKSKAQQKFMGMVHALQKGEIDPKDVSQDVRDAAKSMKKKDAKDFASTKTKNLPDKVKEEIQKIIKEELKILKEAGRYHRLYEPKAKRTLTKVSRDLASFTKSVIENDNDFKMDDFDQMIKEMQFIRSKVESFRTKD